MTDTKPMTGQPALLTAEMAELLLSDMQEPDTYYGPNHQNVAALRAIASGEVVCVRRSPPPPATGRQEAQAVAWRLISGSPDFQNTWHDFKTEPPNVSCYPPGMIEYAYAQSPRAEPGEVARLKLALKGYGKHPEECEDRDGRGACASHMAYTELTEQLEAAGWTFDELTDRWIAPSAAEPPRPEAALELAVRFHETYERLAPSFGYETRKETRAFDPTTPNGRLMVAVCGELLAAEVRRLSATPASAPEGWRPIAEAPFGVTVLVRGWGEAKKHYVFGFAQREKTRSGGERWIDDYVGVASGDELWFAPHEFQPLPAPPGSETEGA